MHSRHAIDFDAPPPSSRVAAWRRLRRPRRRRTTTKKNNNENKNKNNEEEEEEEEENDDETITHRLDLDVDSLSVLVDALLETPPRLLLQDKSLPSFVHTIKTTSLFHIAFTLRRRVLLSKGGTKVLLFNANYSPLVVAVVKMPKSKRDRVVALTKTKKKDRLWKESLVQSIRLHRAVPVGVRVPMRETCATKRSKVCGKTCPEIRDSLSEGTN